MVDDAPAIDDGDPVGQVQRRAPVGDEERRAVGHQPAQRLVDRLLGGGVDGAGGVVEHEDRGVVEQGAGKRHPLALAAGEAEATFTHQRVVAAGQRLDERVRPRRAGGGDDLCVTGVGPRVGDVVAYRLREQEALLERDPDMAAQRGQRHVDDVVAVDPDRAGLRVVEAGEQHQRRRLAAAAGTDERDPLAGGDLEREAVEHRLAVVVPEAHVVERDRAAHVGEGACPRTIGDRGLEVEQLEDPLDARARLLRDGDDVGQALGGGDELRHVGREGEKRAQADLVAHRHPAAEGKDRDLPEGGHRLQHRLEAGLEPDLAHLRAIEDLGTVRDALQLAAFLAERLDHSDAVEPLVDHLHDVALALLGVPAGGEHPGAHPVGQEHQHRHHGNADQRQQRRQPQHHPSERTTSSALEERIGM